ncbi:MAG: pirin family protein [Magnetospirillum sp.]|nr:pirin family protein [Magnetospirillum sp.]
MLDLRPFDRLGRFANDWLDAHYHFSFSDYHDPERMGLGALRVWNDDAIAPGTGFPLHGHRDMEIVTYVREGVLTHEDSLGNRGEIEAGQVQVMSAGTGIRHSEANRGPALVRLFQIWIVPDRTGHPPRWAQEPFPRRHGAVEVLASGIAGDGGLFLHQQARVLGATLDPGDRVVHRLTGRRAYLVAARGTVTVNGLAVGPRAGLAVEGEADLTLTAADDVELVMVETA